MRTGETEDKVMEEVCDTGKKVAEEERGRRHGELCERESRRGV